MPAARPRMHVTPTETAYRLLQELSKLTGDAPATITRELLDEAVPALEMAVLALRDVQKRPDRVHAAINRFSTKVIHELTQAQLNLDDAMKNKPGRKPYAVPHPDLPHPLPPKGRGAANTG